MQHDSAAIEVTERRREDAARGPARPAAPEMAAEAVLEEVERVLVGFDERLAAVNATLDRVLAEQAA